MNINSNELFVGDTLPENPREEEQTFEDIFDGLHREFDRNETYIDDMKSKVRENKVLLGQYIELVSKGEADIKDYEFINSVKDSIASSKFHLLEVLREQNHIRDLITTLMGMRNERDKKLTDIKDEQNN